MKFNKPSSVPRSKLVHGLKALDRFWARGLFPQDLDRHYFLHWFVIYNGNIIKTAEALQIHRNTIQGHFLQLGYSKKSVRLRHAWQKLDERMKSASFEKKFHTFYKQMGKKPTLSPEENKNLVELWQTKFSFNTLSPHYLLWALRTGKSKEWVQKKLDYSDRHRIRLLSSLLNPKGRDGFWLSPLKPTAKEIYSRRYRTILSRRKR
jgi:hypothetical protein